MIGRSAIAGWDSSAICPVIGNWDIWSGRWYRTRCSAICPVIGNWDGFSTWEIVRVPVFHCLLCQGIARTQSPLRKNYALESPAFGVIAGVSQTGVQWKGLALGGPPSWSWYLPCQVSMLLGVSFLANLIRCCILFCVLLINIQNNWTVQI